MSRILIVEDDRDIAELVAHYLQQAGHTTQVLTTGTGAVRAAREWGAELAILDVMLPGQSGLEIYRSLRADPDLATLPLILLTARAEEADRIRGLEIGADDYVVKPFSPREVVARVNALLRRTRRPSVAARHLQYGPITVDLARHLVTDDGRDVHLTAKEFLLLQYLLEHEGRVVSRDLLLTDVWGYQYTGGTRTVDVHVRRLREKLPILASALTTVKQFGYKLEPRENGT
jgi:DNA-binding response OmpR family regulator